MNSRNTIFKKVEIGAGAIVEDYCVIGVPPRNRKEGELVTVIGCNAWIRSHTVIYAGNQIGNDFHTGNKANIREMNTIGNYVSIGTLSAIEHHVTIGDYVRIHTQAFIPEYSVLEDHVWIGPHVVLTNARYPLALNTKKTLAGPIIRKGARIGANSTLLPGITIGENAFVGAGSVVIKDVPDGVVVVGNPARIIKYVEELFC